MRGPARRRCRGRSRRRSVVPRPVATSCTRSRRQHARRPWHRRARRQPTRQTRRSNRLVWGARVKLVGFRAAHRNGTLAAVTGPLNDRGWSAVTTDAGRTLGVRAANLRVVAGQAAAAEPVDGASEAPAPTAAETAASAATTAKACFWAACGNELSGEAAAKNRCGRCKRAYYCSRRCQKRHWGHGGHKEAYVEPPCCAICLDGGDDPEPTQCGCGCRGDTGLAHVVCRAEVAARKQAWCHDGWCTCPTCGQAYTGAMLLGLACEAMDRVGTRRRDDPDRLVRGRVGRGRRRAGRRARGQQAGVWQGAPQHAPRRRLPRGHVQRPGQTRRGRGASGLSAQGEPAGEQQGAPKHANRHPQPRTPGRAGLSRPRRCRSRI